MRLFEVYSLLEGPGKIDFVVNSFGPRLEAAFKADPTTKHEEELGAAKITELLAQYDPTPNQKYLVWIAKLYADGKVKSEDMYKFTPQLTLFTKLQPKLQRKDIMQYSGLPDLAGALKELEDTDVRSNKQVAKDDRQQFIDNGEAEVVYEDEGVKCVKVNTEAASCEFGKGTQWCTAATKSQNYFDDYNEPGSQLIILYPKKPAKNSPYQIYINDENYLAYFMDALDDELEAKDIVNDAPGITKYFLHLIDEGVRFSFSTLPLLMAETGGDFKKFGEQMPKYVISSLANFYQTKYKGLNSEIVPMVLTTFGTPKKFYSFLLKNRDSYWAAALNSLFLGSPTKVYKFNLLPIFTALGLDPNLISNTLTTEGFIAAARATSDSYHPIGLTDNQYTFGYVLNSEWKLLEKYFPNVDLSAVLKNDFDLIIEDSEYSTKFEKYINAGYEFAKKRSKMGKLLSWMSDPAVQVKAATTFVNSLSEYRRNNHWVSRLTKNNKGFIAYFTDPKAVKVIIDGIKDVYITKKLKSKRIQDLPYKDLIDAYTIYAGVTQKEAKAKLEADIKSGKVREPTQQKLAQQEFEHEAGLVYADLKKGSDKLSDGWTTNLDGWYNTAHDYVWNYFGIDKPTKKTPPNIEKDFYMYAAPNSYLLAFSANGDYWLQQFPYAPKKKTGKRLVYGNADAAKVFRIADLQLSNKQLASDLKTIVKLLPKSKPAPRFQTDTDFTEAKKPR